jgi:hypothetical protein
MLRYSVISPLVAVRLSPSDTDKTGVMAALPLDAVVEALGPSQLGRGMIDVSWHCQRYAVFERDLTTRAVLEPNQEMAGD